MAGEDARRDGNKVPAILGYDETNDRVLMMRVSAAGLLRVSGTFSATETTFTEIVSGETVLGASAAQLPSDDADFFILMADIDNTNMITIGSASVAANGGIELDAGMSFDTKKVSNLNIFYGYVAAGTSETLHYIGYKE